MCSENGKTWKIIYIHLSIHLSIDSGGSSIAILDCGRAKVAVRLYPHFKQDPKTISFIQKYIVHIMGLSENRLTPKLSLLKLPFWEASDFFRQTTKTVEFLGHPSPTGLLKDGHAAHSTCRNAWHGVETPGTIGRIEMPRDPWSHTHQEQGKNTIKYSRAGNTVLTSFQVLRNNKLGIPSFQSYNLPKTDSPGAYVQNCGREEKP